MSVTAKPDQRIGFPAGMTRRRFLTLGLGVIGSYISLIMGIPLIGYVLGPVQKAKKEEWVQLGLIDEFKLNQPKLVEFTVLRKDGWIEQSEKRSAWVVAKEGGDFTAFASRCTHLGCAFSWQSENNRFFCPCHDGQFAIDGKVVGGPPPRPLDTLNTKAEGGNVYVEYKEFQLGVSSKTEL